MFFVSSLSIDVEFIIKAFSVWDEEKLTFQQAADVLGADGSVLAIAVLIITESTVLSVAACKDINKRHGRAIRPLDFEEG